VAGEGVSGLQRVAGRGENWGFSHLLEIKRLPFSDFSCSVLRYFLQDERFRHLLWQGAPEREAPTLGFGGGRRGKNWGFTERRRRSLQEELEGKRRAPTPAGTYSPYSPGNGAT
jgi:hypothetical protein